MQFTGSQLTAKRSIYTQNANFGFAVDCLVDNTTGRYDFGVSGDNGVIAITLQSGRMMLGNVFLHNYTPYERFYVECQITTDTYNVLKNDTPMVYGVGKVSGNYDTLFFSRNAPTLFADFNVNVSGQNVPNVTIQNQGYLLTSTQSAVTGFYSNNGSYPVRVFDSTVQSAQDLDFSALAGNVAVGTSSGFAFSGDFDAFDFTQPILVDFSTNYGNADILFTIVDARSFNRFVILQNIPTFTFNAANQLNRNLSYSNYSGGFITDSFPAGLSFSLQYVSGSGTFSTPDFIDGARYSTMVYGSFLQSGVLTGQTSFVTGNGTLSGSYVVDVTRFGWATGPATGTFSGMGTGLASGDGYTGAAYGSVTGTITAQISDGSGTFLFNSLAVGSGFNAVSANYPSYINATGYLTVSGLHTRDFFYIGTTALPIVKGVQFTNETGLVYYLSGAPQHKVSSYTASGVIYLESLYSGSVGNSIFVAPDSCDVGSMNYSPFLTSGADIGATGLPVVAIAPFLAPITQTITGSGNYSALATGFADGTFYYTKTFTGQWDLLTGTTLNNLVSIKRAGNFTDTAMGASGNFTPNGTVAFRVAHVNNAFSTDEARLVISGGNVLNPIVQMLSN